LGWRAELHLRCERRAGAVGPRTVVARKHQLGPLTLQRAFHPEGETCHLYPLHPPGGVVGGDELDLQLDAGPAARVLATTPGAAKFYRSAGGFARQHQRLDVAADACLEWLPQPSILFPGARVSSRTEIELTECSGFIGWEVLSLGRPVIGERFLDGELDAELLVRREGTLLLADRLRIASTRDLDRPSGLRGFAVTGTLVAARASTAERDVALNGLDVPSGMLLGVTVVDDLLVARALADTTEPMQRVFCALWAGLRPGLLGRHATPPRIWAT
jgi:urease accessory protein